ncbi:hypothetical protein HpHNI86_05110 [Helicobacter pylori]|nr:hypothetical protein VN1176_00640 [Helicobacter pylori]GHP71612.1 hypothetical protein VN0235_04900 [Helicobacter pylori]GHQ02215.1 hypothetical protein VN0272_01940 [Helicobacter pylori]GHQ43040.1 hypothetical protein VN1224_03300 [Helicobacter pylori]GHQ56119.1 hypothetical protein VN0382_00670 [Helicobacter pylori]
MTKKPARKILSFSTTMRNPKRIGQFLAVLGKFENQILKSSTIMQIVKSVLAHRLYRPTSLNQNKELKEKFDSNGYIFSDEELERIVEISPQQHKERALSMDGKVGLTLGISLCVSLVFATMQNVRKYSSAIALRCLFLLIMIKKTILLKKALMKA